MAEKVLREAKKVMRSDVMKVLETMSEENRLIQSKSICRQIIDHDEFKRSQRISLFINMKEEIDTRPLFIEAFNQGKKVFIPRIVLKSKIMDMVAINSMEELDALPTIKWGLRQHETFIPEQEARNSGGLDLMIVPGVSFDPCNGNRLGHGAGYYDHYFAQYQEQLTSLPYLMGICFKEQIRSNIPMGNHDFPVIEVITAN